MGRIWDDLLLRRRETRVTRDTCGKLFFVKVSVYRYPDRFSPTKYPVDTLRRRGCWGYGGSWPVTTTTGGSRGRGRMRRGRAVRTWGPPGTMATGPSRVERGRGDSSRSVTGPGRSVVVPQGVWRKVGDETGDCGCGPPPTPTFRRFVKNHSVGWTIFELYVFTVELFVYIIPRQGITFSLGNKSTLKVQGPFS